MIVKTDKYHYDNMQIYLNRQGVRQHQEVVSIQFHYNPQANRRVGEINIRSCNDCSPLETEEIIKMLQYAIEQTRAAEIDNKDLENYWQYGIDSVNSGMTNEEYLATLKKSGLTPTEIQLEAYYQARYETKVKGNAKI